MTERAGRPRLCRTQRWLIVAWFASALATLVSLTASAPSVISAAWAWLGGLLTTRIIDLWKADHPIE
jgi:hypothetical protein